MLLVLLLLSSLLNSYNQAQPIFDRAPPSALDAVTDKRSIFDIVWSCVVTTFLCAWVSVHPNVQPYQVEGSRFAQPLKKFGRRIGLLFFVVALPEITVIWATMEYLAANQIQSEYKDNGWTMAHAYLLEMGGFALRKSAQQKVPGLEDETLTPERFKALLTKSEIEFPTITECEIQDRSKGDAVAKLIAALQTSWFVLQCVVRHQQGLAITELELTTLALAAVNMIVLWLWRAKPLDVGVQVPVYLKEGSEGSTEEEERKEAVQEADAQQSSWPWLQRIVDEGEGRMKEYEAVRESCRKARGLETRKASLHTIRQLQDNFKFRDILRIFGMAFANDLNEIILIITRKWRSGGWPLMVFFVVLPFYLAFSLVSTLIYALGTPMALLYFYLLPLLVELGPVDKYHFRVFTIVSVGKDDLLIYFRLFPKEGDFVIPAVFIGMTAGLVFGGLHCAGWNFTFPTTAEQTIWRVTSSAITLIPLLYQLLIPLQLLKKNLFFLYVGGDEPETRGSPLFLHGDLCLISLCTTAYLAARLNLIALALTSLREQPASAYVAVRWTKLLHL